MVFKRRPYRRYSRRRPRKSYRRPAAPRRRTHRYMPFVLPSRYSCRLRYVDEISINSDSGVVKVHDFRANDLYDPNCTGAGHQPMGFDTLTQNYDHFTVIGSKITVKPVFDQSSSNAVPGYWGVALVDAIGTYDNTSATTLFENERVGRPRTYGILNQTVIQNQTVRTFSLKRFFNVGSGVDDDRFQCDSGNSPPECAYFEVYVAPIAGNDPGTLKFIVTIEFIVVCHEPKKGDDSVEGLQRREEWLASKMKQLGPTISVPPKVIKKMPQPRCV